MSSCPATQLAQPCMHDREGWTEENLAPKAGVCPKSRTSAPKKNGKKKRSIFLARPQRIWSPFDELPTAKEQQQQQNFTATKTSCTICSRLLLYHAYSCAYVSPLEILTIDPDRPLLRIDLDTACIEPPKKEAVKHNNRYLKYAQTKPPCAT